MRVEIQPSGGMFRLIVNGDKRQPITLRRLRNFGNRGRDGQRQIARAIAKAAAK